ncbi:MAG: type IV pilus modification protein PilV [bacterium]|nr:type IV pilus modification protein PilV [bacterium]
MHYINSRRMQKGVGMMEILAAVLVLAVGVLGFASLQVRAVQASGEAYFRSQSSAIALDLAERVRVNDTQRSKYLLAATWPTAAISAAPTACITASCTPAAQATFDAQEIIYDVQTLLPQGEVNMEPCKGSAVNCIYIGWNGTHATASAAGPNQCVDDNGKYVDGAQCIMMETF